MGFDINLHVFPYLAKTTIKVREEGRGVEREQRSE